jgi:hypothetical protein
MEGLQLAKQGSWITLVDSGTSTGAPPQTRELEEKEKLTHEELQTETNGNACALAGALSISTVCVITGTINWNAAKYSTNRDDYSRIVMVDLGMLLRECHETGWERGN